MKMTVIGHWGGYPAKGEASSDYLLQCDDTSILLDCGSGALSHMQEYINPLELDGLILSHYHADHVADVGVLQHAYLIGNKLNNRNETLSIFGHNENEQEFQRLTYKGVTKGRPYDAHSSVTIGPFSIQFLRTEHSVPCFAMKVTCKGKVIVYTADSAYQPSFIPFAEYADLLLCESNFYVGMDAKSAGHMTSREAGFLALESKVKKLVLTHLPHFGSHETLKKEAEELFKGPVLLADKGLVLEI
ncbi:MBL fold metallo-hydrolase [Bacillus coahuilensis]|uniref:MBL fold metallo-hydrolase n=1 Tax=Bacillus coahuilensis TaxID=408580 RepID=UPI0002FFB82E|nr:MBL fold metallo-hydrolase [Bacillus coahuilensis]